MQGHDSADYQRIFRTVIDSYLVIARDFHIVDASDNYLRDTLTQREGVVGRPLFEVFPDNPDDPDADGVSNLRVSIERVFATGEHDVMPLQKYDVARPDGSGFEEKYWSCINSAVFDADGEVQYVLHRAEDVTNTVQAERKGRSVERTLQTLLATLPCVIYRGDAEGGKTIETISEGCLPITGYSREDFLEGRVAWSSLIHPEDALLRAESQPVEADATLSFLSSEYRIVHKDGAIRWVEDHHRTVRGDDGRLSVEGVVYEVTQRKTEGDELRRSRAAAEVATQAKSAFLASMSHEIRTPMNAIIGMTTILLDSALSDEQRDAAEMVRASGEHLLTIINDILDYSKIEAGKVELETTVFCPRDCVESAIDIVAGAARKNGIELGYVMHARTPERVEGDVGRLRQVLVNLLSNAVKFTPARTGQVLVELSARALDGSTDVLEISVKDNGVGISDEAQRRLFRPFEQADLSTTRVHGGTGLGLSICQRLVDLMGGSIGVQSQLGKGALFRFDVKVRRVRGSGEHTLPSYHLPSLQGRRVLVVDDVELTRHVVSHYVTLWGMEAFVTDTPRQALEWLARGDTFDLLLLDAHLASDKALMQSFRANHPAERVPIVLLSTSEHDAVAEAAAVLSKPLKPSRLLEAVTHALLPHTPPKEDSVRPAPGSRLPSTLGTTHPLRILVAEDNVMNQKLARVLFGKMGYQPDFVSDGREAIAAIERQTYDVVFMDVLMPVMDGIEATRVICERWPAAARPRIVGMSANAMREDRAAAERAGMDDYVPKPVPVDVLVSALERCLRR